MAASHTLRTGDLACNSGMCSDWELNRDPLICMPMLNPLSHTSQAQTSLSNKPDMLPRPGYPLPAPCASLRPCSSGKHLSQLHFTACIIIHFGVCLFW